MRALLLVQLGRRRFRRLLIVFLTSASGDSALLIWKTVDGVTVLDVGRNSFVRAG